MPEIEAIVVKAIRALLERRDDVDLDVLQITHDADLFEDLTLDSLEVAELSATLEDDLGRDPYSAGLAPRTVGEVLAFYEAPV